MIVHKPPSDLLRVDIPPAHRRLIQDAYGQDYDPEKDGHLVYVEAGEDEIPMSLLELNFLLREAPFEGSEYHPAAGCREAILVTNNSFALNFIIPDTYISDSTREALLSLN